MTWLRRLWRWLTEPTPGSIRALCRQMDEDYADMVLDVAYFRIHGPNGCTAACRNPNHKKA